MAAMRGALQHLWSRNSILARIFTSTKATSPSAGNSGWGNTAGYSSLVAPQLLPPACVRAASGREKLRVVVAVSGGVDSSVGAMLLKDQGHDVVGVFMRNWDAEEDGSESEGGCSERDRRDAQAVCHTLGIPLHEVDFVRQYWDKVFTPFLRQYQAGATPNPDLGCNTTIKFGELLQVAAGLGAEALATGHYARLQAVQKHQASESRVQLLRASDSRQDQSYFLASVDTRVLHHCLFPVGHMRKAEVRALAEEAGLLPAHKRSSRGICFVGQRRSFGEFMRQYAHPVPGQFVSVGGGTASPPHVLGPCEDVLHLTPGQRVHIPTPSSSPGATKEKAAGHQHQAPAAVQLPKSDTSITGFAPLAGALFKADVPLPNAAVPTNAAAPANTTAAQDRVYVVGKDMLRRVVYVAQGWSHPALFALSALITAPTSGIRELLSTRRTLPSRVGSEGTMEVGGVRFQYKVAYRQEQLGICTIRWLPEAWDILQARANLQASRDPEQQMLDSATGMGWLGEEGEAEGLKRTTGFRLTSRFHRMASEWLQVARCTTPAAAQPRGAPAVKGGSAEAGAGCATLLQGGGGGALVTKGGGEEKAAKKSEEDGLIHTGGGDSRAAPCSDDQPWVGQVVFDTPVRGLAPGQALVLYDQDTGQVVVGAATILLPGPTLMEQQQS